MEPVSKGRPGPPEAQKTLFGRRARKGKSGPFFLGKFTHIDINLMCCFHRLIDIRLDSLLEMDELPNLKAYWNKLKERESYKQGILNFYGEKEIGDVEELFGSDVSMHLKPLTKMIQNSTDSL